MDPSPLSDVQYANYLLLSLIRDTAREDLGKACCRFGLSLAQLQRIAEMPPGELMAIVAQRGNEALFKPHPDFDRLIATAIGVSAWPGSAAGIPDPSSSTH